MSVRPPVSDFLDAFVLFDTVALDEGTYALLLPANAGPGSLDAVVMRVARDADGLESLVPLHDPGEWRRVAAVFATLLASPRPRLVRQPAALAAKTGLRGPLRGPQPPALHLVSRR